MKKRFDIFVLPCALFFLITQISFCSRNDINHIPNDEREFEQRFFDKSETGNPIIQQIAYELKLRNVKDQSLIKGIMKSGGMPSWDKSVIKINHKAAQAGRSTGKENDTVILIPLIQPGEQTVNAYIETHLNGGAQMNLHQRGNYQLFSYGNLNAQTQNAEKYAIEFMLLDNNVFGYEKFRVNDSTLFRSGFNFNVNSPQENRFIVLGINSVGHANQRTGGDCYEVEIWYNPDGDACNCSGDEYFTGETYWEGDCNTNPSGGNGGFGSGFGIVWGNGWGIGGYGGTSGGGASSGGSGWTPMQNLNDFPYNADPLHLYNGMGIKPFLEYADTSRCAGFSNMWNNYPNNEVMSYITADGKLIVTNILPIAGGTASGLYTYSNPATNSVTYYYTYPMSQGAPTLNYSGIVNNGINYYIPVVASVHTHSPCRTDNTNGVSHPVGQDDQLFAQNHPSLRNWVIGCDAIARFNNTNPGFFNVQAGLVSNTCSSIY